MAMLHVSLCGVIQNTPILLTKSCSPELDHALPKESLLMNIMDNIHRL